MKYLFAALFVLVMVAACNATTNDVGVHILHARAEGLSCDFSDDTKYKVSGAMDLAGAGGYYQVFSWENTLQPISTKVGSDEISDPTHNTFYAHQAQLSYSTDQGFAIADTTWDLLATIAAQGASTQNSVGVELFPPNAL